MGPPSIRSSPTSFSDDAGSSEITDLWRGAIGDVVSDTSCGGCPASGVRNLCYNGTCVVPTCHVIHEMGLCNLNSVAGVRARQFCPRTCGCTDPVSSLVLSKRADGCPGNCISTEAYTTKLVTVAASCSDMNHLDGPFQEFLNQNMELMISTMPSTVQVLARVMFPAIRAQGCPAIAALRAAIGYNLCAEGGWPVPMYSNRHSN
jgi:hypothetical protein